MADEDEVIVALSGDTSTTDVVVVEGDGGGGKKAGTEVSFNDDDGDPVADLKKQFTQMSGHLRTVVANQQQTEQQLAETTQRLQRAESTNQLDTIENGIAQVENDLAATERALAAAFDAGDGAAVARAQRALARGEAQLSELTGARENLKQGAQRQPAQQRGFSAPARSADPVEAVASTMSPKSAAWIRAHPECITDKKLNARMMAAHNLALADDIAVDSDEYFERINAGIKPAKKPDQQQVEKKPAGDGRRPSSAAASGGAAGGGLNGGTTTVKLTRGEAASATDGTLVWNYDDPSGKNLFKKGDPIGLAEMARRKHEGMRAGLYDKNAMEA